MTDSDIINCIVECCFSNNLRLKISERFPAQAGISLCGLGGGGSKENRLIGS